ncbi:MAG: hypothetical protein AAGI23_08955 [Bacteroidota bacterium]
MKSPIIQSIHWVVHTATVINTSIPSFDQEIDHHHHQEVALEQLDQLQELGNDQSEEEQKIKVEAPKKKIQITPTTNHFTSSQSRISQHQFIYICTLSTPFSIIDSPPPEKV